MPLIPSVSKSWLRGAALFSLGGALVVYTALLLFPAPVTTPSSPVLVAYDLSTIGAGAATLPAGGNISRASTGSAQTGTSTVVTGIAVDTPRGGRRLDADPVALVVEEGRTNRVLNSANWTLGGWAISGGGSTNTANAAASPRRHDHGHARHDHDDDRHRREQLGRGRDSRHVHGQRVAAAGVGHRHDRLQFLSRDHGPHGHPRDRRHGVGATVAHRRRQRH
jgi:hypothetical protein